MPANEALLARVRRDLSKFDVEEKKMFGGVAFLVRGKMCVTVGKSRIMIRVDPTAGEKLVEDDPNCTTVIMRGREYKGWIHVAEEGLDSERDLRRFIKMALDYNAKIKKSD